MGLMDKVRSQATALAEKAQEGAKAGQEKLSALQAKHHADALLLELGGLTYLARTGRATPADEKKAEELVGRLSEHEAVHGPLSMAHGASAEHDEGDGAGSGGHVPPPPAPTSAMEGQEAPAGEEPPA
jgi:hypothetical protein